MPLMVSENGQQRRIVPARSVGVYLSRGWTVAAGDQPADDGKPATSDRKADWIDWAVAQGADRDHAEAATKADLVEQYG